MSDFRHTEDGFVPLAGLLDLTAEALLVEFRKELEQTEYGDIRPTHGCVFRFVRADEGMRLTDLAGFAGMTKQGVGEIVDELVEKGYAKRIPDPEDGRAKLIQLTDKGVEAQKTGRKLFAKVEARWAKRYGEKRMRLLRELLEEIIAAEMPFSVPELAKAARPRAPARAAA
jgi:DNA-binding MarR family transcriptional regulator